MLGSASVGVISYDARILTDQLKRDSKDADAIAKRTGDSIADHTEHGTSKASAALKRFGQILFSVLAVREIIHFGEATVKAFSESQDAIAQTEAVLKSTNQVAGVTAKVVTDLATSLQKQTKYSDESIRSAENMLLTFTNIGKDVFPDTTRAVLDMSTAMGQDLQSTSIQVGKALQDPVLGATALQRVGVRLTESQKDLIQQMVGVGDTAGAQKVILQELQREFGGSAEAAGGTFSGSLAKLKNSFNDVQEAIGGALVKGFTPLAQKMSDFVASDKFQLWLKNLTAWMEVNLPKAANYVTNTLLPALKNAFDIIWPVVQNLIKWAGDLFVFLTNNEPILWAVVGVFGAIKTAMLLEGALSTFKSVIGGATTAYQGLSALVSTPMVMPAIAIAAALAAIWEVYNAGKALQKELSAMNDSINSFGDSRADFIASLGKAKREGRITQAEYDRRLKAYNAGLPGNAMGTNFWRGGPTWVGEQGPEIVNLPRGAQIIPNHEIDSAMTSNQSNVTVSVNMSGIMSRSRTDERDIARSLIQRVNEELRAKHLSPIGEGAI